MSHLDLTAPLQALEAMCMIPFNNVVIIPRVSMDTIPCYRKDAFLKHGIVVQIQG